MRWAVGFAFALLVVFGLLLLTQIDSMSTEASAVGGNIGAFMTTLPGIMMFVIGGLIFGLFAVVLIATFRR